MNKNFDAETELNLKMMIIIARMVKVIDQTVIPDICSRGLTPSQFGVLEALLHKGPLTVNEIIEKTLSTSGNMGLVISNLERSGLVLKKVSETDRRSRTIELTDEGRRLIEEIFPFHVEVVNRMFSGIELSEKEQMAELMKKLSKSIGDQL